MEIENIAARVALRSRSVVQTVANATRRRRLSSPVAAASRPFQPLKLTVTQPEGSSFLQIELRVDNQHVPSGLWAACNGDFLRLGSVRVTQDDSTSEPSVLNCSYSLDLDDLVVEQSLHKGTGDDDESEGYAIRLYLEYPASSDQRLLPSMHEQINNGSRVALARLGKARETVVGDLALRTVADHKYYALVTRKGHLVVEVDRPHRPYARVINDEITVDGGRLLVRGRVYARGTHFVSGDLVVLARTSDFKATVPIELTLDESRTAQRYGLRHYNFSARLDFQRYVAHISDDNADLYLDLTPKLPVGSRRARIGKSRFLVRLSTNGGKVVSGHTTVSIIPYYTFKAKNPSLHLEVFDTSTYDYLQESIKISSTWRKWRSNDRPVWLIGELPYKAQDNGLHFFKYLRDNHPEIDAYYVIDDLSPERVNLQGYDHVVGFRSKEHIRVALVADKIIGTHSPDFLYPTREPRFQKRLSADKVFLQHGVTAAKWMVPNYGKYTGDFATDLVIVCSDREKEFYVNDFGYSPSEVAVTGFARFDALFVDDVKTRPGQLMIMPTWRPWLQDPERFTDSDYFRRWYSLLTGEAFRRLIEKYDLEPILCLHPNMQQFSSHFMAAGVRVVVQGEVEVQFLLKQSSMLVTDYSSVAFDFAFLHKPVLYYQFDARRFAKPHADPDSEFPGPVVSDEGAVVAGIDRAYASGARMQEVYKRRADRFVAHRDTQSRRRIFDAVSRSRKSPTTVDDVINHQLVRAGYRIARKHRLYLPVMKRAYKLMRLAPLDSGTIVFEAGQSRQFGDSPRAIFEELVARGDSRKKVWIYKGRLSVKDEHTVVVRRHSPAFFWYLATAKYWVNNHNFPHYIHRRKGGVYIQTWHGTPLKKMFLDQEHFHGRDEGYIDRVKEASAQWSALLSPSPYATTAMRSSYGYKGPVYEIGYPRNDILTGPNANDGRSRIRAALAIPLDKFVVLYAPTFRDDQPTTRGRFEFNWPFSVSELVDSVGPDVVLLVRTHFLVSNKLDIPEEYQSKVVDVSEYPDIQELFLASDVLVTDYSSSFFDFSILNRPIIFFAYDLTNYRENLRGFYLDYESDLPGPIVETPSELFERIQQAREWGEPERRRLQEFAAAYAPNDDGHAATRVVDRLLTPSHQEKGAGTVWRSWAKRRLKGVTRHWRRTSAS